MPRRLYDLLPPEVRAKYPPESLDAPAAKVLLDPSMVPDTLSPATAEAAAQLVTKHLPRFTGMRAMTNRVRAGMGGELGTEGIIPNAPGPADKPARTTAAMLEGANPAIKHGARLLLNAAQAPAGVMGALTGQPMSQRFSAAEALPPARTPLEHAEDVAGNVAGFMGATIPLSLIPGVGPVGAAGVVAASQERDLKSAAISGVTTAGAAGLSAVAGKPLTKAVSRLMGQPRGAPAWVRPGAAATAAGHLPGAVAFGAGQPLAAAAMHRLTGEKDYPLPTVEQGWQGVGEMLVITAVTHGPAAFRAAAAKANPAVARHAELVANAVRPPRGTDPARSKAFTEALNTALEGKRVMLALPGGSGAGEVTVQRVFAYKMPGGAERITVLVTDPLGKAPVPVRFDSGKALVDAIGQRPRIGEGVNGMDIPAAEVAGAARGQTAPAEVAARRAEVETSLARLEANRPGKGDKGYRRWAQRVDRLRAERDQLRASAPSNTPSPAAVPPEKAGAAITPPRERAPNYRQMGNEDLLGLAGQGDAQARAEWSRRQKKAQPPAPAPAPVSAEPPKAPVAEGGPGVRGPEPSVGSPAPAEKPAVVAAPEPKPEPPPEAPKPAPAPRPAPKNPREAHRVGEMTRAAALQAYRDQFAPEASALGLDAETTKRVLDRAASEELDTTLLGERADKMTKVRVTDAHGVVMKAAAAEEAKTKQGKQAKADAEKASKATGVGTLPHQFESAETIASLGLGIDKARRPTLQRRSPDGKVWTDGHIMVFMDALERPADAAKYGPVTDQAKVKSGDEMPYPNYEQVVPKGKDNTVPLEPVGLTDHDRVKAGASAVLAVKGTDEHFITVNARYLNFLHDQLGPNIELLGNKSKKLGPIVVKKNGKVAGLIMPTKSDVVPDIAAMRSTSARRMAEIPEPYHNAIRKAVSRGALTPKAMDAVHSLIVGGEFSNPRELDLFLRLHRAEMDGAHVAEAWKSLGTTVRAIETAKALVRGKGKELSVTDAEYIERAKVAEKELLGWAKLNVAWGSEEAPTGLIERVHGEMAVPGEKAPRPSGGTNARLALSRRSNPSAARPARLTTTPALVEQSVAPPVPRNTAGLPAAALPAARPRGPLPVAAGLLGRAAEGAASVWRDIVKVASPLSLVSARAQDVVFKEKGRTEAGAFRIHRLQRDVERFWSGRSNEEVMDFLDRHENGRPMDARLKPISDQYRERADNMFRAIAHFKDVPYWENWFPHAWKDPAKARAFFSGRRPMEGSKSFTKERFYADIREGMKAGLEPLSWNPETLMQAAEHNARKFVMVQRLRRAFKATGLLKFGALGSKAGDGRIPEGFTTLNQNWTKVYLNPVKEVSEHFDAQTYDTLVGVARAIGASVERKVAIGGKRLGYSQARPGSAGKVVTKFATPLQVLSHELGHAIDAKYGMRDVFLKVRPGKGATARATIRRELKALAALHIEGIDPAQVPQSFKSYINRGQEKMATMLELLVAAPERFADVAPKTHAALMEFFDQHSELRPLKNIKRGLVLRENTAEVHAGGAVLGGEWWVEENLARILDNHMSRDWVMESQGGRTAMASRNFLNAIQLGVSGFHLTNLTFISAMNRAGIGTGQLLRGNPEGLRTWARAILAPKDYFSEGHDFYRRIGAPDLERLERDVFTGGAKLGGHLYYNEGAFENFKAQVEQHGLLKAAKNDPRRAAQSAVEASQRVLAAYAERLKVGAFRELLASSLQNNARRLAAGEVTRETLAREAWTNVEARLGLLNYDNLFWDRSLRTSIQLLVRAPGWRWGTVHQMFGAPVDAVRQGARLATGKPAEVTDRMAFALTAIFTQLAVGGVYHYLHTGRPPKDYEDFRHPENGQTDEKGQPVRVDFPTDLKTAEGWAEAGGDILTHKQGGVDKLWRRSGIAPEVAMANEFVRNEDWRGKPIDSDVPTFMKWAFGSVTPFSFQQQSELGGQKPSLGARGEAFMGVTRHRKPSGVEWIRVPKNVKGQKKHRRVS